LTNLDPEEEEEEGEGDLEDCRLSSGDQTSLLLSSEHPSTLKTVCPYILVTEFCERLAYYGFAGSLVLFFQRNLNYSNAQADAMFALWAGACYLTPLLGGWMADRYLGRFKTILYFCVIYVVGLGFMVLGSSPDTTSEAIVFPAMYIIALGTGGIKPNVVSLGADQFDETNPLDKKEKESFFNYFYWSINLGALVSYLIVSHSTFSTLFSLLLMQVAYICQYGIEGMGGEDWGFFVGYSIPLIAMVVAVITFTAGTSKYKIFPPGGSIVEDSIKILWEAGVTKRGQPYTNHWLERFSRFHLFLDLFLFNSIIGLMRIMVGVSTKRRSLVWNTF